MNRLAVSAGARRRRRPLATKPDAGRAHAGSLGREVENRTDDQATGPQQALDHQVRRLHLMRCAAVVGMGPSATCRGRGVIDDRGGRELLKVPAQGERILMRHLTTADVARDRHMEYLRRVPSAIPADQILVHNAARPTRRLGMGGFRAWLTPRDRAGRYTPCECHWASELGGHFRSGRKPPEQCPSPGSDAFRLRDAE